MKSATLGLELTVVGAGKVRQLEVTGSEPTALNGFQGTADTTSGVTVLRGPLSTANAAAVRKHIPSLTPRPAGLSTSAGLGDRIGSATPGHVQALLENGRGITPFFAQQSIREMDRLGRGPQQVLDDATFGCLQAGWEGPVGADADHLKTTVDIDRALEAGFTTFTLDAGELVRKVPDNLIEEGLNHFPWHKLEDDRKAMVRRYEGFSLSYEGGVVLVDEAQIQKAALKYGLAVAHSVRLYRHLLGNASYEVEVEIAVDETEEPTSPVEHIYIATELARLGVKWVSFAPRYVGRFEKGVDYIGELGEFRRNIAEHAGIARVLGPYKISLHSGSDKFRIYELAARESGRLIHLKTSGTSYLEALSISAKFSPDLFRKIHLASVEAFRFARESYAVSASLRNVLNASELADDALLSLLDQPDSRQILHVGYSAVLLDEQLGKELRDLLDDRHVDFDNSLRVHLGRHLQPFSERGA